MVPAEVLAAAYKKFLDRDNPPPVSVTSKGGKNKGKGKYGAPNNNQRSRWPPPKAEVTGFDLLMLPHPEMVNRDEETYVIQGPLTYKTRVTKENWDTLRFNTKTMSSEYFPSSYLSPRSTITGTVENFRTLLLVPLLSKKSRISSDVYRVLSLNIASEATQSTDKATAPKRISAFLRLCALYIPCEFEDYEDAVKTLDSEVDPDLRKAKIT